MSSIEERYPRIPVLDLLELEKDTLATYLLIREGLNKAGVCENALLAASFAGAIRGRLRETVLELEAAGLIELVWVEDDFADHKWGARLLKEEGPKRLDRMPPQEWASIRKGVFERDDYTCQYCGVRGGKLECDHVTPLALGGTNEPGNLVTACADCNRSKHAKPLSEWRGRAAL